MILAATSALQGHDSAPRGYLIAGSVIAWGVAAFLFVGWYAIVIAALAGAWWPVFRSGKQARIEMQYMDTGNAPNPSLLDVLKAHYYVGLFTIIALKLYNYSTTAGQKLGWEQKAVDDGGYWHGQKVRLVDNNTRVHPDDFPFLDCRRPTEIATGLTGDTLLIAILLLMGLL